MKPHGTLFLNLIKKIFTIHFAFGTSIEQAKENSIIFLPHQPTVLSCGISAFVAFKGKKTSPSFNLKQIDKMLLSLKESGLSADSLSVQDDFFAGDDFLHGLFETCQEIKQEHIFAELFFSPEKRQQLAAIADRMVHLFDDQTALFKKNISNFSSRDVETVSLRLEKLADIHWCLKNEILDNISAIGSLAIDLENSGNAKGLYIFKRVNAVLNSIDRLEVRGRDSAGISVIFTFTKKEFENFRAGLIKAGLSERLKQRTNHTVLNNNSITINDTFPENGDHLVTISYVYKFAAEIGALGDNVSFIRSQIKNDHMLQLLAGYDYLSNSVSAHTRWASIGDITVANCHPQDNTPTDREVDKTGIIHVCLNGDIDNYLELKSEYEARYDKIHTDINTDTKLIPLQTENKSYGPEQQQHYHQ